MKSVYIVGGGNGEYRKLFSSMGFALAESLREASLVCFTGGEDVTPALYGDHKHPHTYNNPDRDEVEKAAFGKALLLNIPMVGICRGGQFLNVMNGGRMYQHVTNHCRPHSIVDCITGETVYVSSTHHQMIMPTKEALLVATANLDSEREWFDGGMKRRDASKEGIEVVFYQESKSLCFQPHPEFGDVEYEGLRVYFASLLTRYMGL